MTFADLIAVLAAELASLALVGLAFTAAAVG